MENYTYQNGLISKKQLRKLLAWSFTTYSSMQACSLADELKYLGFRYASQAGISISIEDLQVPFVKTIIIEKANQEITNSEKLYLKGRITSVERFQKIIDTWNLTSESLKSQIVYFFKNYDPLNSVYIMAFSGARGNLSQVRQLVGMRGLMSDPSGEMMNLPIKKNFREGLTITDYLMSGYGARKGIVDTALKTANSGYLTRRLIDVSQDIIIREKDCSTSYSILFAPSQNHINKLDLDLLIGCVINKPFVDFETQVVIAKPGTQITTDLIQKFKEKNLKLLYLRSPLTCNLYRAVCQACYGWDLASENLVDIGEAIGILAGQSIGEPGTQLTMRTFHTGGIFTSRIRQQITSPISGIFQIQKSLKTMVIRTNRGEDVSVTKNAGFVTLISNNTADELTQIRILPNTILFPKNNQYISRDTVIGELIDANRQLKSEVKPILSDQDGEIIAPQQQQSSNSLNKNQLVWILFGTLFHSPNNAFLNFYHDYKIQQYNCVSRSKLVFSYDGALKFSNKEKYLQKHFAKIINLKYCFINSQVRKLKFKVKNKAHLLHLPTSKYLISTEIYAFQTYLKRTVDGQFGSLLSTKFQTLVGGQLFYDTQSLVSTTYFNQWIDYFCDYPNSEYYVNPIQHSTISWLEEEVYNIDCEPNALLVDNGNFVSAGFEIMPNIFSKTSGFINLEQQSGSIKKIWIKSGIAYQTSAVKNLNRRVYYPGEKIFSNITTEGLIICESFVDKEMDQLLVRPIKVYEIPKSTNSEFQSKNCKKDSSSFKLCSKRLYVYNSGQRIRSGKSLDLILDVLLIAETCYDNNDLNINLINCNKSREITFQEIKKLQFTNYIVPSLKYRNLQSCFLAQNGQFLSRYAILGYLETIAATSIEIIGIKVKQNRNKEILIISNANCVTVSKKELPDSKLGDLITDRGQIRHIGKIIIENEKSFTLQKGKPYFFPNCDNSQFLSKPKLQYKILPEVYRVPFRRVSQKLSLEYYDMAQISSKNLISKNSIPGSTICGTINFSKLFLNKNGKLYTCMLPQFYKNFHMNRKNLTFSFQEFIKTRPKLSIVPTKEEKDEAEKFAQLPKKTIAVRKSEIMTGAYYPLNLSNYQLSFLTFVEQNFRKSRKAVGLYSITEDYFEQETNSVFCKDKEFIEIGTTIGLLNLEKEITGDIIQGLPRIEEILEARKKNSSSKNVPTSRKKRLLTYATSLDISFEFKKLGTLINENDKINPHKLLKVYFNYYGLSKRFSCTKKKTICYGQLTNNYDGSYRSFKKVQLFILNSVQAVYKSQGVTINNKHLEVIIKQMTTKVIITYEGSAPLLQREIVDLYHIKYINKIVQLQMKETACYVPLLLGITKSALNNPSFISAASFQETTRVLTKAAIEGRVDWLRGLKENIITGHLIPAGTGSQNYRNAFRQRESIPLLNIIEEISNNSNRKNRQKDNPIV